LEGYSTAKDLKRYLELKAKTRTDAEEQLFQRLSNKLKTYVT
jgi:hypothetical protein